jgi:hypothetical protein
MAWQFGVCGFALLFVWQHVGRLLQWKWTPAVGLNWIAGQSERAWRFLGTVSLFLGHVFDYIYHHTGAVLLTLQEVTIPILRLLASPFAFFSGWWDAFKSFSWECSGILAAAIVFGAGSALGWHVRFHLLVCVNWVITSPVAIACLALALGVVFPFYLYSYCTEQQEVRVDTEAETDEEEDEEEQEPPQDNNPPPTLYTVRRPVEIVYRRI